MKNVFRNELAVFAFLLSLVAAQGVDVSGQWRSEFDSPVGQQKYIYTFQADGEKLTGKAVAELRDQKREVELQDGLIRISRGVHVYLKAQNVPHIWYVDGNAHDSPEWRNNFYLFSQRIFR